MANVLQATFQQLAAFTEADFYSHIIHHRCSSGCPTHRRLRAAARTAKTAIAKAEGKQ